MLQVGILTALLLLVVVDCDIDVDIKEPVLHKDVIFSDVPSWTVSVFDQLLYFAKDTENSIFAEHILNESRLFYEARIGGTPSSPIPQFQSMELNRSLWLSIPESEGRSHILEDARMGALFRKFPFYAVNTVPQIAIPLQEAMRMITAGSFNFSAIKSLLHHHARARKYGVADRLASAKVNLGVLTLNLANQLFTDHVDVVGYPELYRESETLLSDALRLDPGNKLAARNLDLARRNLALRDFYALEEFRLYNPHVTLIGDVACQHVVLRRLNSQALSGTLFTCDDDDGAALLWVHETEPVQLAQVPSSITGGVQLHVHRFPAYDARSLVWNDDLCWISSGGGWSKGPIYPVFHCVPVGELLLQMARSRRGNRVLPLLHARGGRVVRDTPSGVQEKNWSPFVVQDKLYMVYSISPLVVMGCDWAAEEPRGGGERLLSCASTPGAAAADSGLRPPFAAAVAGSGSGGGQSLRGSSVPVRLPGGKLAYLCLGHVRADNSESKYRFFFYVIGCSGEGCPPFRVESFGPLFRLPTLDSFRDPKRPGFSYAHGIHIDGGRVFISYGVEDAHSRAVDLSLAAVMNSMSSASGGSAFSRDFELFLSQPFEMPATLFGKPVKHVFAAMPEQLRFQSGQIAIDYMHFVQQGPRVSVVSFLAQASSFWKVFAVAARRAEEGSGNGACLTKTCSDHEQVEASSRLGDADAAFLAYCSVMQNYSSALQAVVRDINMSVWEIASARNLRQFTLAMEESANKQAPARGLGNVEVKTDITFVEALSHARKGRLTEEVLEAMQREDVRLESLSKPRADVKLHLGVALLKSANSAEDMDVARRKYRESKRLLYQAKALDSTNENVLLSIDRLERNMRKRGLAKAKDRTPSRWAAVQVDKPELTYAEALRTAMRGREAINEDVIKAFRREHVRVSAEGNVNGIISVKINLAVALTNLGSESSARDDVKLAALYLESRKLLRWVIRRDPENSLAKANLQVVSENIQKRDKFQFFNPSVAHIGHVSCKHVVIRRILKEQLSSTLFMCDNNTDKALLWSFESENVGESQWMTRFRKNYYFHRAPAHDARVLMWGDRLCWITSGWAFSEIYMMFHCVGVSSFVWQMERSLAQGRLLPLLGVRGGKIQTDNKDVLEKNWIPFVVEGVLYLTYSIRPHVVKRCEWNETDGLLYCRVVQRTGEGGAPAIFGDRNFVLRGSSTGVMLPGLSPSGEPEFLGLGHIKEAVGVYTAFFYKFSGRGPPFSVQAYSPSFNLSVGGLGKFGYGHGLYLDGEDVIVTFGLNDDRCWSMRLPLRSVLSSMSAGDVDPRGPLAADVQRMPSVEYSTLVLGSDIEDLVEGMYELLVESAHPLANDFVRFMEGACDGSLEEFAREAFQVKLRFQEGVQEASRAEPQVGPGTIGKTSLVTVGGEVLERATVGMWAYASMLCRENRLFRCIVKKMGMRWFDLQGE